MGYDRHRYSDTQKGTTEVGLTLKVRTVVNTLRVRFLMKKKDRILSLGPLSRTVLDSKTIAIGPRRDAPRAGE